MLLRNGDNLFNDLNCYLASSKRVTIYCPYIKLNTIKHIIDNIHCKIEKIIVRWHSIDLVSSASDLDLYIYLKEKGIPLFRNPRLHLKAFVDNYKRAFIGSANISQRALNFPETPNYNYELGVVVNDLTIADSLYFRTIEAESTLITDEIYIHLKNQLAHTQINLPKESDFPFEFTHEHKSFLISSLPMSYDVATLIKVYEHENSNDEIELNYALHDLALYGIPLGLERPLFINRLKESFFDHPFIKAFLKNLEIQDEVYFGRAKDWIQKNCSDAPIPRKWEITSNIQILYRWIVELGDGNYLVDRPNYSERLFKTVQTNERSLYYEKFINELSRDKVRGTIAPHQIILLISFFNLYHATSRKQFEFKELADEFYASWKKYQHLFKSKNNNIGMPLHALYKRDLIEITVSYTIIDYRNIEELSQKIKYTSFNKELIKFLKTVDLDYLESRINR